MKLHHNIIIGYSLLVLLITFAFANDFCKFELIDFVEQHIADDHNIQYPDRAYFRVYFTLMYIVASMYVIPVYFKPYKSNFELCKKPEFVWFYSVIGFVFFLYLLSFFIDLGMLHEEDGLMENLTALGLLFSSGLQIYAYRLASRINSCWKLKTAIALAALVFFILAMEEISWGQRLVGWTTPEVIVEYNYQDETNIHNMFNPVYFYIQLLVTVTLSILILNQKYLRDILTASGLAAIVPSKKYMYLAFVFPLAAVIENELMEELFVVFVVSYSIDLVYYFKSKSSTLLS